MQFVADPRLVEAPAPADAEPRPYRDLVKPVLDRVVALVAIVLLAPVLLLVAAAVALSLGRPLLFRQERVGLDGRRFNVLKFRTMHADRRIGDRRLQRRGSSSDRRRTHKSDSDPRHTTVGRFLRKWSLDELPQLVNVLKGEMSIVGPRPELVSVVETKYTPEMHRRHRVRPGITGLWQVSARGDGLMFENPEADLEYVDRQSLLLDLEILLRTPLAALGSNQGE